MNSYQVRGEEYHVNERKPHTHQFYARTDEAARVIFNVFREMEEEETPERSGVIVHGLDRVWPDGSLLTII